MRRVAWAMCMAFCAAAPLPAAAQQGYTSTQLIENAASLDGQEVSYSGEVVGEVLRRATHAWVNVHDGNNAVGCWVPLSLAERISQAGRYGVTGDRVLVQGRFSRACREHGGDLDIHVNELSVAVAGEKRQMPFPSQKKETALLLLGVLCLAWILKGLK
jgi:hypothetical protein